MGLKLNPITGQFDLTGSGGGGSSVIADAVDTFDDLPQTVGTPAIDTVYLVREDSGTWNPFGTKRVAGLYIRSDNTGTRANDWTYLGAYSDVFLDGNFLLANSTTPSKVAEFDLSGIASNTTRTISVPDKNITLDDSGDTRDPNAHASSHQVGGSDAVPCVTQSLQLGDSGNPDPNDTATIALKYDSSQAAGSIWSVGDKYEFRDEIEAAALSHTHVAADIDSETSSDGYVLTSDGAGNAAWEALPASGISAIGASAADVFSVGGTGNSELVADDAGSDKLVFWDDSASALKYLTAGSGLTITDDTITASGGVGGGSGSVDNAIIRAQGTGGSEVQSSDLVIDDAVVPFNITGDASTDIITAVGHNYSTNQGIRFPTLTGGSGLSTTTTYFVRDISGDTFKVSTTSGGSAVNFTTNISAGTVIAMQANVAIRNNSSESVSALVLTPKGATGAFILGPKPDGLGGLGDGGNPRGDYACDLQLRRSGATTVASGAYSAILGGYGNTASGQSSCVLGSEASSASVQDRTLVLNSFSSTASGAGSVVISGSTSTASSSSAIAIGPEAIADRTRLLVHSAGRFSANGDAQRFRTLLRRTVNSATATELFLDGSSTRLTVPSGKTIAAIVHVVATTSGGEFACQYVREFVIRNRGGTTELRGTVQTVGTDTEDFAACDLTITANDTNDAIRIEFQGTAPVTGCTGTASTDRINKVAHGFNNNDDIVFSSLTGGAGLTANTVTYWVINANADDFQVSATRGGAAVNITTDYSDMTATRLFRVVASVDAVEVGHGT